MSNLHRGHSIDASYQVSVHKHGRHMPFLFLIGRFLKIFFSVTAQPNEPKLGGKQKQELPVAAMFVIGSEINEQSL
jgi:hypothetical protein